MRPAPRLAVGLRGRLLGVFLAMMLVASLGSTALISRLLAARSRDSLDGYLLRRGQEFQAALTAATGVLAEAVTASLEKAGYDPAELAAVVGLPDGRVLATASALRLEEVSEVRRLLDEGSGAAWAQTPAGRARVAARRIELGGTAAGVYVAVRFTDALDRNRREMVRLFLAVLLGSLLLAGIVGYFLAGEALEPLRRITRTARLISREDLSRRIGSQGAHDQIGELAATFDEMLGRLEAAFTEQQRFLSDVSHELRTPMQVIKGHLEVLQRLPNPSTEEYRGTLALVLDEVDRMARLIGQLLTLARSTGALVRKPVALRPFLEEIARKAESLAPRRFAVEAEDGITVLANRDALTQIMLNLLQNAVDNTTSVDRITIGAAADPRGVRLWVADTGRGIPAEAVPHLFERFFRVGENGGAGLGLAIVDALARAHGGRVEVQSRIGQGSTFQVFLPRE